MIAGRGSSRGREAADEGHTPDELDRLASAAATGGPDAVEALLVEIERRNVARGVVAKVVFDHELVDEATQDTLVSVAASVGSWRGEGSFAGFVAAIARRRAVDVLRRQRGEEVPSELGDRPSTARGMSTIIAGHDRVEQLLARLAPATAEAVRLRDVQGLPYEEVARRLDVPASTCRTRVARGRAQLAAAIVEDGA